MLVEVPFQYGFQSQVGSGVLDDLAELLPYGWFAECCIGVIGWDSHHVDMVDRHGGQDCLKDLGYRDHPRRKVEAYQRCIRPLLGGCGVISIRDEDLGVVTGPSEDRVDFGVDQLVLQHGTLGGWQFCGNSDR